MSTIVAGELAGMSRATALEFSFLFSIPTMIAATCYDLLKEYAPLASGGCGALPSTSTNTVARCWRSASSFL